MEESRLAVEYRAVVASEPCVMGSLGGVAHERCDARQTPHVVCRAERNSHRLSLLESRYVRVGLFFTFAQCGYVSVLLVEIVYPSGFVARPRSQSLLLDSLPAVFERALRVHLDTFIKSVGYHCHAVV